MKNWKIVPAYSFFIGKTVFRVYKRYLLIFWTLEATEFTMLRAEEVVKELNQPIKYI